MQILKPKHITWIMLLLVGMGYFNVMSNLEINYFFKSMIAIMPIQILAMIHITYLRPRRH
ncbi:hypothetical protein Cylst_6039 [Cylindrospermum stagnale PCC 7417]|uniref:Uncharacterized protein n=1 Tax=Cylindrospermum stagnale PCC 7417 TaxID=56107 RepID=K9X8M9_9NOST|nr:hypothetical protein Cylst_6039 [Cylindrospermum stagnale PCC 7417]